MKQLSGTYSEIEFTKEDSGGTVGQAHRLPNQQSAGGAPALQQQHSTHVVNLNSGHWDETVQKLAVMFSGRAVAAGVPPAKGTSTTWIKTRAMSPLQEDENHYYTTAVIGKRTIT